MRRLNLGCGADYRHGWDNWDISQNVASDYTLDIRTDQFPVDDGVFDEIYCSGVLEQILTNESLTHCLNECHRTMKVGGILTVIVPSARYINAFRDPNDCRQFTEETFRYFDHTTKEYKLYGSTYGYKPWRLREIFTNERGIVTARLAKV